MTRRPTTLEEIEGLARTMAGSPAQAVSMAAAMADQARELPPPRSELLSRPLWARGSLWTSGVAFEFVPNDGTESPPQIIRLQHDIWIRGVEACVIFQAAQGQAESLLELQGSLSRAWGNQNRWAAEANWRVDARQGFVSSGQAEILAPLNTIAGDGAFSAALDWKLQKDQTIEVRARSRLDEIIGADELENAIKIRMIAVTFFGESLRMPGVQ